MISNQLSVRDSRRRGVWKQLAAGAATILLFTGGIASAQSVAFHGQTFVNKGSLASPACPPMP